MAETATRVGFVGLGNMGLPMSGRLVEAGYDVIAFDLAPEARERAAAAGATPTDVVTGVAEAEIVILMLPNSAIVTQVLGELTPRMAPGTLVIDMSSSEPGRTRELAAELEAAGLRMIDAPVSGGVKGAVAGKLTVMAAGAEADLDRATPVLEVLGRVVRAGTVGAGHAIKALNNLLSATHLWVTSEAIAAGERFGLDPATMLDVFNGSSGKSGSTENKWPNFILPGTFDSGFGLRLMLKDMKIAVAMAADTGAVHALGEAAVELWEKAAADLEPTADHTEVAAWIESASATTSADVAGSAQEGGEAR
jgi:3-hydroxyisobutyrate dehydrogenase